MKCQKSFRLAFPVEAQAIRQDAFAEKHIGAVPGRPGTLQGPLARYPKRLSLRTAPGPDVQYGLCQFQDKRRACLRDQVELAKTRCKKMEFVKFLKDRSRGWLRNFWKAFKKSTRSARSSLWASTMPLLWNIPAFKHISGIINLASTGWALATILIGKSRKPGLSGVGLEPVLFHSGYLANGNVTRMPRIYNIKLVRQDEYASKTPNSESEWIHI